MFEAGRLCSLYESASSRKNRRTDRNAKRAIVVMGRRVDHETTTRKGRRCSTYNAFFEGKAENLPNLTIITGAQATRVVLENLTAKGVEYRTSAGEIRMVRASSSARGRSALRSC
jgi:choline dehydrogenase-like flavoprotein